jgi:excisionase family DNA binding protein
MTSTAPIAATPDIGSCSVPLRDTSFAEAAEMIGVSPRTMRRAVERGEIEAYKLLGNTRVKLSSLLLFVQRARSVPLKLLPPASPGKRPRGRPKRTDYASAAG